MSTNVLFIVPYPRHEAASQRFRVELYENELREAGIKFEIASFLDKPTWDIIFKKGHTAKKTVGILKGYMRRIGHLFKAIRYDNIFIHREATPLGPPVFEWILAKVLRKRVIFDFDDAIWIPNVSQANSFAGLLKAHWKIKYICKWATVITAGNEYLCSYARQFSDSTILLPTCVDTENVHNTTKQHHHGKPVVGWTGSHSTLSYLHSIVPIINDLQQDLSFTFLIICDKKPQLDLIDWHFQKWNSETETDDLLKIDIGIMPLKEDSWSQGKCGFKLIQYLSCGIPALADPIGVNEQIVRDGDNGFLCNDANSWKRNLSLLINDPKMRADLGTRGRQFIIENYSLESQRETFLNLFLPPITVPQKECSSVCHDVYSR